MSNPLEMLPLKNGGTAPASAVYTIMINLESVWKGGIPGMLAVVDLVEYCRMGNEVAGRSREILINRDLLEQNGGVHDIVKDVVLSAAEGEGLALQIGSPLVTK